ncbi:hypothetical protein [Rhizobium ruizarguesonis]|uniref:hypothetical protein n=1 Tax=Rhizobium ruizarguesonis TaxID=2081791 RepID=UPI001980F9B5|nr:hypothetical protein [Rhizobium ruizarguesonis]
MMYRYEDLGDDQFEDLIVILCRHLLGAGVRGFAKGPDGGRDAKFMGVAQLIPSTTGPWSGTVIVQAKHTNAYNKSFHETDFFNGNSETTVIGKELPRIRKLRDAGQLDHYMLFSNRKLGATINEKIWMQSVSGVNWARPDGPDYMKYPETPSHSHLIEVRSIRQQQAR